MLAAVNLLTGFAAIHIIIDNTTTGGINGTLATVILGDIIILDERTYKGNNNTNMTINKNIIIQGKTKDKSILDAQKLTGIFTLCRNCTNITFINGNCITSNCVTIYNNATPGGTSFIDCIFNDNIANYGGAIGNLGSNSKNITVVNYVFNNTGGYVDGGIYTSQNSYLTIINSTFTGGNVTDAATIHNMGVINVINYNFTNNSE